MCGVVGRLGRGPSLERSVRRATDLLEHRGVRDRIIQGTHGAIGHVRLPIVGLGTEHDQPLRLGNLIIGFVGEILDFKETTDYRGEDCDLYTVARLILGKGPQGLQGRDGFWGIVVLDDTLGKLTIITDYLAQKPMYYRADARVQAGASEIDPLVSMGPVSFDEIYMSAVAKWGYCPDTTRTPFNEIKHLLPGEAVTIDTSGHAERRIVDPLKMSTAYASTFKGEINKAIKRRVTSSDVPMACLTSGGLDSSIVYAIGSRYGDLRPYYATTKRSAADVFIKDEEYLRAREVVKGKAIQVIQWSTGPMALEKATSIMQEPIDLGSLIPQMALSEAIKEDVCLTGDGADEVFGGYGRSARYDSQMSDIYQELVAWHLPRLDRVMMRNMIEVRSPFLARGVVELGMGLSHELRRQKDMLKILYKPDIPASVLEAPKLPLRSGTIERDREANTLRMIRAFRNLGHYRPSDPGEMGHETEDYVGRSR